MSLDEALRMAAAAGSANALTPGGGRLDPEDYKKLLPVVKIKWLGTFPEKRPGIAL
jgi:hypothetical protein